MSKLFAILVYDGVQSNKEISTHYNLGDVMFLLRSTVQGHIQSIGKDIVKTGVFPPGRLSRVTLDTLPDDIAGHVYIYVGEIYKYIIVCESAYPSHVLLSLVMDLASTKDIAGIFTKYVSSSNNKIEQVKESLNETLGIMKGNLDLLIERQGKIESIVLQTEKLEQSTQIFFRRAKDVNSCCTLL